MHEVYEVHVTPLNEQSRTPLCNYLMALAATSKRWDKTVVRHIIGPEESIIYTTRPSYRLWLELIRECIGCLVTVEIVRIEDGEKIYTFSNVDRGGQKRFIADNLCGTSIQTPTEELVPKDVIRIIRRKVGNNTSVQ